MNRLQMRNKETSLIQHGEVFLSPLRLGLLFYVNAILNEGYQYSEPKCRLKEAVEYSLDQELYVPS